MCVGGSCLLGDGEGGAEAAVEAADGEQPGAAAEEEGGCNRVGPRQARDQVRESVHHIVLAAMARRRGRGRASRGRHGRSAAGGAQADGEAPIGSGSVGVGGGVGAPC